MDQLLRRLSQFAWCVEGSICQSGVWQRAGISSPSTVTANFGSFNGNRDSSGSVYCNAGQTMVSGGVACPSTDGLAFVMYSYPLNNGWYGFCGDSNGQLETMTVYALCAP